MFLTIVIIFLKVLKGGFLASNVLEKYTGVCMLRGESTSRVGMAQSAEIPSVRPGKPDDHTLPSDRTFLYGGTFSVKIHSLASAYTSYY